MLGVPGPFEGLPVHVVVPGTNFDPGRMYRLSPGSTLGGRFPILGNGFTVPPLRLLRAGEGLRVACLGDSTTFGIGAGPNDAYARRLTDAFARAFGPERADVLNAGCPGYSSAQSLRLLVREVALLRPSIVVAYLGSNNEYVAASGRTDEEVLEGLGRPPARLLAASHVLRFLAANLLARRSPELGPELRLRVPPDRFEADLARIAEESAAAGALPAFVVPVYHPHRRAVFPATEEYAGTVRRIADRAGVPALDLTAEFRGLEPYPLYQEPIHLGRAGHRLLAGRLFDFLISEPVLAGAFERVGLGPLRAFEALAARAETGPVSEEEASRVRGALAPLRSSSPPAALAHSILSLGEDPIGALVASSGETRDVRRLALSLAGPARSEEPTEGETADPLAGAFGALARNDLEQAALLLGHAAVSHPSRPGIRRLLYRVESARGNLAAAAKAREEEAAVRAHLAGSDPLDAALSAEGLADVPRPSPALARGAALLLHRDRLLGGTPVVDRRVARALELATRGSAEGPAAILEEVLRTNPAEPVALGLLAQYREDRRELAQAEELWRRSLEADPGNWLFRLALARCRFGRGEGRAALDEVERVLAERPEAGDAWALGIRISRALGDRDGTERLLRGARDHAPEHPSVRAALSAGG